MPRATDTHTLRLCNNIAFTATLVTRNHLSDKSHVHCLSCCMLQNKKRKQTSENKISIAASPKPLFLHFYEQPGIYTCRFQQFHTYLSTSYNSIYYFIIFYYIHTFQAFIYFAIYVYCSLWRVRYQTWNAVKLFFGGGGLWRCDPTRVMASSFLRFFLDHTQQHTTDGRTPLDEWSARRRDLYLTTNNTHNRQISMPTVSAGEPPQIYVIDRPATGTGSYAIYPLFILVIWPHDG
jgi:hypothetical protein